MGDIAWTELEQRALSATELSAFPINLRRIRQAVADLLNEVGRYGFFSEYTDHSFRHVEGMLRTAEWLIPQDSWQKLSAGDALLLVLAIYFHDVGLLISRDEFTQRATNPDFQKFKHEPVISAVQHAELRARLERLDPLEADRIWYQEFVRFNHGARIRAWIEGAPTDVADTSAALRRTVHELFQVLEPTLRSDLAMLCESHTRDDISDICKYKVSQPYGDSPAETANVQYVAVILRAVDLLQITKKRAPSILYQVINPTDPLSQLEWQKQNAVRSVRAKPGLDREGNATNDVQSDTIEVHARFEQADGFFGLTSYLAYAQRELQSCFDAVAKSASKIPNPLSFPWRFIDSSNVDAAGFLKESFGFTIDQQKILDLLTGHTLYNDTNVVLRELTQNALDAVRLQKSSEISELNYCGEIAIVWNSKTRELTVTDNGTGMSQEVIINHLLKVGSSRYQDPRFKERFPEFSSISRFGIGVLTAFMVSDDVEITTCSPDDDKARRIALRSVHGKYLIKLLDKVTDRDQISVFPHGTSVKLVIRPTAKIGNILEVAKMWLLFPQCRVTVQIDENPPTEIGYSSPKAAIEDYVSRVIVDRGRSSAEFDVIEVAEAGVTLAFAVSKGKFLKDRSFVEIESDRRPITPGRAKPPCAICIEGVGVEFASPGFRSTSILAIANACGPTAPKTNVARSALEDTVEQREMIATIYRLYARHVGEEIDRLMVDEGYSLTRAVGEAPYIASHLINRTAQPARAVALQEAVSEIPMLVVESAEQGRRKVSFSDLIKEGSFWTVDSPLSRSIEYLVREAPGNVTAHTLLDVIGYKDAYPRGWNLLNFSASEYLSEMLEADFEVSEVVASEESRRISLRWERSRADPRWVRSADFVAQLSQSDRRFGLVLAEMREGRTAAQRTRWGGARVVIPLQLITARGLDGLSGFIIKRDNYFLPDAPVVGFLRSLWLQRAETESARCLSVYFSIMEIWLGNSWKLRDIEADTIRRVISPAAYAQILPYLGQLDEFIVLLREGAGGFFNPFAWDRGQA